MTSAIQLSLNYSLSDVYATKYTDKRKPIFSRMNQSKLVHLFQVLSTEDFRQIQKMLKSPYFTSNQNLLLLYKILRNKHPNYNSSTLQKEKVFSKIFPNSTYSDNKMRNLMSELRLIVEQHLKLQQLGQDCFGQNIYLAEALIEKGDLSLLDKVAKQMEKQLAEYEFHTHDFYYSNYRTLQIRKITLQSRDTLKSSQLIMESAESLEHFYHFTNLQLNIELRSLGEFAAIKSDKSNEESLEENIIYQLFKSTLSLIETNDIDLYHSIKKQLFNNLHRFDSKSRVDIFSLLLNFTVRQMNLDDNKFNTLAFNLYKDAFQYQIFDDYLTLIESHFFNIVAIGSKEKEFDWTIEFMQSHQHLLNDLTKNDLLKACYANLYFHQGHFSKAIDTLVQYNFTSAIYNNFSKIHLIRCYFELFMQDKSYYDLLIAQSHSFEKYSRRNKYLSEFRIGTQLAFAQYIRKMAMLQLRGSLTTKEKNQLHHSLQQHKNIVSRSWLVEKIEALV